MKEKQKGICHDDSELLIVSYKDDATAFNGLKKGTIVGKDVINNRMSNLLMQRLEKAGLILSGTSPDGRLVETVELTERPFHVGVQYHPEFKSRPNKPHPLFKGFIGAAFERTTGGKA